MTQLPPDDDDYRDGCCDVDAPMGPPVPDEWVPWVVLFASVLDHELEPVTRDALEARAGEWRALFAGVGDA